MTQLNILAPTRLARVAAECMVARGRGAIINLSSTSVFFPVMSQASPYVPAKAYMLWFSQRLSRELRGTGVAVQALCLHYTRTDWFENAQSNVSRVPEGDWMDAATVVHASLRSLALGETVCVPPLEDASLLADLRAVMDRIRDSLHGQLASRYAEDDRTAQA